MHFEDLSIDRIKEEIQSCNINFFIGAGASRPFLPLLGDIENRLDSAQYFSEKVQIQKEYFEGVMLPNINIIDNKLNASEKKTFEETISNYKEFFQIINQILLQRESIVNKQANIFTTNIDILIEYALEVNSLEYNDGFTGNLFPKFDISNFKKTITKRSHHFDNISEIPTFNLFKIHGSLNWQRNNESGTISSTDLQHIDKKLHTKESQEFLDEYNSSLAIINPQKQKLEHTTIDTIYYELLRIYSAELEKENTVLFVLGFSMNDEHIKQITLRAANANPTLLIYIFCHSNDAAEQIKENIKVSELRYSNIKIIEPTDSGNNYDLKEITSQYFSRVLKSRDSHDE